MRFIKEDVLNGMAIERQDAIDRCYRLGKQFISHFHKIYKEGKNSLDFNHHCQEMQTWLDSCRDIRLKATNRLVTPSNLIDWFFTATGNIDEDNGFDSYEEIDAYNEFMLALAAHRESKVFDIASKIMY